MESKKELLKQLIGEVSPTELASLLKEAGVLTFSTLESGLRSETKFPEYDSIYFKAFSTLESGLRSETSKASSPPL